MKYTTVISKPTIDDPESGTEKGLLEEQGKKQERAAVSLKWVLLAIAAIVVVITTVTLIAMIFLKINQLDREIEIQAYTKAQLGQRKQTPKAQKKPIAQEPIERDEIGVRPDEPEAGQSISLSRDTAGSPTYTVKNWLFDDWVRGSPDYDVIDNAYITIKTAGIYTIQAQVSFRTRTGMATYQIKKKRVDETTGKSLSQCVTTFDKTYAQQKSCFTSTTSYLKPGDQIYVDIFNDNLTVDFKDGKSTFGVVKIQDSTFVGDR